MRFTNKFPYTTVNNINLDWIIKRVKELGETVRSYAQDIANAVALAEAAQEAAESVTGTAESAVATAQAAEATANAIAGTANNALATAQAAETRAQAAEATANAIAGTANTALATAQAAEATAQVAETRAQAAEESADNAETIAGTASANASNAVQTANTALATAEAALVMAGQGDVNALNEKAGKLVDTETGAVVSFVPDRTIEQNLSVTVAVVPIQEGSGDPSPDNRRPISGRNVVNIMHSGADTSDPTIYAVQLGETVYGGTLNVTGGTMTVDRVCTTESSSTGWTLSTVDERAFKSFTEIRTHPSSTTPSPFVLSNYLPTISFVSGYTKKQQGIFIAANSKNMCVHIDGVTNVSEAAFNTYLSEHPLQICYTLATPIEIVLTPAQISALVGEQNNLWSDTGNVTVEFAADLKWYIDTKIAELQALVLENGG